MNRARAHAGATTPATSTAGAAAAAGPAARKCRNVISYGYCKHEPTGCPFNHDGSVYPASAVASPDRKQLRVDSPSYNPLTYSPGVFTAQHYEHYRSASQERAQPAASATNGAAAGATSGSRSVPSSTVSSPLVSRTRRNGDAVDEVTAAVGSLGLAASQDAVEGDYVDPAELNTGAAAGTADGHAYDSEFDGPESAYGLPPGAYYPMLLSVPTASQEPAQLDHHYYFAQPEVSYSLGGKAQRSVHHFFVAEHLREELTQRAEDAYRPAAPAHAELLPASLLKFHSLVPLEPSADPASPPKPSTHFGYPCAWYRATSSEDGKVYALLRIAGYRLPNESLLSSVVESWRKVHHPNVVRLHEAFTTKAFGGNESSLILVYDYFPSSATMASVYSSSPSNANGNAGSGGKRGSGGKNTAAAAAAAASANAAAAAAAAAANNPNAVGGPVSERQMWTYIVQLVSAIHAVHAAGQAIRAFSLSKVLMAVPTVVAGSGSSRAARAIAPSQRHRVRINAVGALDFIIASNAAATAGDTIVDSSVQQQDFLHLGHALIVLAGDGKLSALSSYTMSQVQDTLKGYSAALTRVVYYLLNPNPAKSTDEIFALCGPHMALELDAVRVHVDRMENELSRELENGRLARLMMKLNFITDRTEFALGSRWSETGDRYLITLFRDYVFHPVDQYGRPIVDVGHVVTCLNKLDVGVPELLMLTSPDERNCLIVSYAELKRCVNDAFKELCDALSTT
ncbi:PAB-dependent poly(A)-specific ribonuclease subunit 3 [Blastocladiella emersonii ATCC 22665]|nr:PAB-dependent poly(A)-specific ribonuclease subunit 3 [Blastocladiella emersonii ATCC 22665]